jgi:hypothetical protein
MNEPLRALLAVRDRFVARSADLDVKALTLLFGIAAVWGVITGTNLPAGPMIAIFLAFAGLFVSVGWAIQRRMLGRVEDAYTDAISAMAKVGADSPLAHDPARDRPAAISKGVRMHYGEPLSMAVFALLTVAAIWSYLAPGPLFGPDMAMSGPEEGGGAVEPELIRMVPVGDGEHWVLVSPYQMMVLPSADAYEGEGCPCDPEYSVAFEPASYGLDQYAPLARHIPLDPALR